MSVALPAARPFALNVAVLAIVWTLGVPAASATPAPERQNRAGAASGEVARPSAISSPDPLVRAVLVGRGIGWALTQHSLERTVDDARTWTDVTPAGLTIHPAGDPSLGATNVYGLGALDARHAFIATEAIARDDFTMTIWRTADGGATWRRSILRHLAQTGHDQCPDCGGGGVTFHALSASDAYLDYGFVTGVDEEVHPTYRTSDGGATWRYVGTGSTSYYYRLAFHTIQTILLSDGRSLYSTTSGWDHLTPGALDGPIEVGFVSAIAFWNTRSWIVGIRGDDFEFAVTSNSGQSWEFRRRALPRAGTGETYTDVQPVAFLDPATWLTAATTCTAAQVCTSRLLRTRNRGHTWQRLGRLPAGVLSSDPITVVDHFHAWAQGSTDGVPSQVALYATSDGGWSWRELIP